MSYEIMLLHQENLDESEFYIPWVNNFEVNTQFKDIRFTAIPITLADYKRSFMRIRT